MGDIVNNFIDNLNSLLIRLFIFPFVFQIFLVIFFNALAIFFSFWLLSYFKIKPKEPRLKIQVYIYSTFILVFVIFAFALDFRSHMDKKQQNKQVKFLTDSKNFNTSNSDSLSSLAKFINNENVNLSDAGPIQNEDGLQVYKIAFNNPLAVCYLAIIDLKKFSVVLDTAVTVKERTSNFAERFGLDIAVNGEAGTTPGLTAPLGQWSGMYVVNGKVIYNEDSKKRPFMFFNREMKCFYSPEAEEIRSINNEMYNVIWGRFDLVRNGKLMVSPSDHTQNTYYPRTAVGIDKSGKKAYLLVADGRDPYYSMGLTMNLCVKVLLNFGCHSAMACDQGGSSNMYSRELGVFTQPGDGIERQVYTHLGFKRN